MTLPFLDTNVLIRHYAQDNAVQSPKATAYLQQIEDGLVRVHTEPTVIFETVYLLEKQYRVPRPIVRDSVLGIVDLPGVVIPNKRRIRAAFALYIERNLPFADAYHLAVMRANRMTEIVTFDREFDHIPGIVRVEP